MWRMKGIEDERWWDNGRLRDDDENGRENGSIYRCCSTPIMLLHLIKIFPLFASAPCSIIWNDVITYKIVTTVTKNDNGGYIITAIIKNGNGGYIITAITKNGKGGYTIRGLQELSRALPYNRSYETRNGPYTSFCWKPDFLPIFHLFSSYLWTSSLHNHSLQK